MSDIVEFEDVFDSVMESSNITTLHDSFTKALDSVNAGNSAVVFDVECLTRPYTTVADANGIALYMEVVSRGIMPYFFSWLEDTPDNLDTEMTRLIALGVSNPVVLLRNAELCPTPKKNMAWSAPIAAYTRSRVTNKGMKRAVVMYVGRKWVDVLPANLVSTAMPTTSTEFHIICRHTESGVWSLRMSPSKNLVM